MNASQSRGTASTSIRFPVFNNGVNKPINSRICEGIPRIVTDSSKRLRTDCSDNWISVDDEFLVRISYIHLIPLKGILLT